MCYMAWVKTGQYACLDFYFILHWTFHGRYGLQNRKITVISKQIEMEVTMTKQQNNTHTHAYTHTYTTRRPNAQTTCILNGVTFYYLFNYLFSHSPVTLKMTKTHMNELNSPEVTVKKFQASLLQQSVSRKSTFRFLSRQTKHQLSSSNVCSSYSKH